MKFSCLIIDDEPYAIEIIESYVEQIHSLELAGKCRNALEAIALMHEKKPDILFLDIEMPFLNGVDFIKTLDYTPQVILITAFRNYAIEGFDLDVTDYLLKPVSFARFTKAVNKAIYALRGCNSPEKEISKEHILFKVDKKLISVKLDDILYIESLKDYVSVQTSGERFVVYQTMNSLSEKLPQDRFFRIQKSFIIAIDKVRSIEGNTVEIGSKKIPVSRHSKEEALALIFSRNISGIR